MRGVLYSVCLFALLALIAAYRLQKQMDDMGDGTQNLICKGATYSIAPPAPEPCLGADLSVDPSTEKC